MNHVIIVRKNKIEKIEMERNLSLLLSVASNPINSEVLSKLNENRNNNVDNLFLKKYYDNILRLNVIEERFDDGSEFFKYYGVENVLGRWFGEIREILTIVANECGEKGIANYIKPSSGLDVTAELTSLCNCESLSLSTFNVISVFGNKGETKLIVKDNDIKNQVDINDGDVILVADEKMLEKTTVKATRHAEILSIHPDPSLKLYESRDKAIEYYLKGWIRKEVQLYNLMSYVSDVMSTSRK